MLEKTGCRDIWQVLANGGIPLAILFLWYFYPMDILYLLYVGALTAVASDTWATEIGVLSKKNPRSILSGKYLETGESGGVTVLGTIGAFFGSLTIAAVALMSCPHSSPAIIGKPEFILLLLSGLIASFSDSVLGASLQAQYQCPICQKKTEKLKHCQCMDTKHIKGVPWLNNDMVNLLSAIFSVLMILIGWFVLLA
jgi:uncharacterized protein (TIGR00297 family)